MNFYKLDTKKKRSKEYLWLEIYFMHIHIFEIKRLLWCYRRVSSYLNKILILVYICLHLSYNNFLYHKTLLLLPLFFSYGWLQIYEIENYFMGTKNEYKYTLANCSLFQRVTDNEKLIFRWYHVCRVPFSLKI